MAPFTNVLPKPLIPINNQTVIERIIHSFHRHGKNDIHISINFKGVILKAYFQELSPTYNVSFIEESKPLGTAGALSKLNQKVSTPFFLTNCDVLFELDYKDILDHCKESYYEKRKQDIYKKWKGRFVFQTTGHYMLQRVLKKHKISDFLNILKVHTKSGKIVQGPNPLFEDSNASVWYTNK